MALHKNQIGDNGQRFEIRADFSVGTKPIGWCSFLVTARRMKTATELMPYVSNVKIIDRENNDKEIL